MRYGVGLPANLPGTSGATLLDWARNADAGPFASLAVTDRIVYDSMEIMTALTAAAAVTTRIRLMTSILLAAVRPAALVAKQAATIDVLSNGRFTLGLGVGAREDDFYALDTTPRKRGKRFEEQLGLMKRIWAGEPVSEDIGPIGPKPVQPGGPLLLIGGGSDAALRRAARWGDGYLNGSALPAAARKNYEIVLEPWHRGERDKRPLFVSGSYFALGEDAAERGAARLREYYGEGPRTEANIQSMMTTPQQVRDRIKECEDVGMDELLFWPEVADIEQVDRLAEALAGV